MIRNNQFVIEIAGVDILLIQEAQLPDVETNVLNYGTTAGLPDVKIAGKKKVAEMTLKKLRPTAIAGENFARTWFESTAVLPANQYKRNIVLREVNEGGITVATYVCVGAFPTKITHSGFNRKDDNELIMEEMTISMDNFIQL